MVALMTQPIVSCSRDPIGYEGGSRSLVQFCKSMPVSVLDPSGTKNYEHPYDVCDGYKPTFPCQKESVCWWRIRLWYEDDNYPYWGRKCCDGFQDMYGTYAQCVAECLGEQEATCGLYNGCDERQRCRHVAHWICYGRCKFVPFKGIPLACVPIMDDVLNF